MMALERGRFRDTVSADWSGHKGIDGVSFVPKSWAWGLGLRRGGTGDEPAFYALPRACRNQAGHKEQLGCDFEGGMG